MKRSSCDFVCVMSFVGVLEEAEVVPLSLVLTPRDETMIVGLYALRQRSLTCPTVASVFSDRCIPQIGNAVVGKLPISMVDYAIWKLSEVKRPSQTMGEIEAAENLELHISARGQ